MKSALFVFISHYLELRLMFLQNSDKVGSGVQLWDNEKWIWVWCGIRQSLKQLLWILRVEDLLATEVVRERGWKASTAVKTEPTLGHSCALLSRSKHISHVAAHLFPLYPQRNYFQNCMSFFWVVSLGTTVLSPESSFSLSQSICCFGLSLL